MRTRMLWAAGLAIAGCNYPDLPPVGASPDAPPGSAAGGPHITLDWQIALPASVEPAPVFKPIAPAPRVRIAPLRATLDANTPPPAFVDATYSADGTIAIPEAYVTEAWRLEYTLDDGVPHEVQWQPADRVGHITVPLIGRLTRSSLPAGAGYSITPTAPPTSYTLPHVFTTGLWSEGEAPIPAGSTIDYDFAQSVSLSGPLGAPDSAAGDRGILIDYHTDASTCRVATGGAAFDPTLHAGSHSAFTPLWETTSIQTHIRPIIGDRLDALSSLVTTANASSSFISVGVIPSSDVIGFIDGGAQLLGAAALPTPVMIPLLGCPLNVNVDILVAKPSALRDLPNAAHIQLVASRSVPTLNTTLVSGIEAIIPVGTDGAFVTSFPAPFATQIALNTLIGKVALDSSADQNNVGAPHGTFTLSFTPETGADLRADYYDVILHRITGSALTTERIYTVTAPSVQIDAALLQPLTDYVFEIRTIKGHPQAAQGDFSLTELPYGETTVMARTIRTGPAQ
ncbi:MAG TPA: hypothetical protein VFP84_26605 [Kofleriaceae bacterium]|nr:hypothetical protein [Kofleriaceae bacterium]